MLSTSARALRLLGLLQARPTWAAAELADRLEVSDRTLRADVARLRELGYTVESRPGRGGGYRLRPGDSTPPVLLADDEVVAVVLGLRAVAGSPVGDLGETSLRALAAVRSMLPARLRRRAEAIAGAVASAPTRAAPVAVEVLLEVARAVRDQEVLRVEYQDGAGHRTRRDLEPERLVQVGDRWYLLAWDRHREDWRTLRADRLRPLTPGGPRFSSRPPPGGDAVAFVLSRLRGDAWRHRAVVRIAAPLAVAADRVPVDAGELVALDDGACELRCGTDSWFALLSSLAAIDLPFRVVEPERLRDELRVVGRRLLDAADGAGPL